MKRLRLALAALAALASACTFEDGHGFATIRSAELHVEFVSGATEDGRIVTRSEHHVRLDEFRVVVGEIELRARTVYGERNEDPQSVCHGGHCHTEDGKLVPEDHAESHGSDEGADLQTLVVFPAAGECDLLSEQPLVLGQPEPSRELPAAALDRVELALTQVSISGAVSSAASDGDELSLTIALDTEVHVGGPLRLDISRDGPEVLDLTLLLEVGPTLFDVIDYDSLEDDGSIHIDASDREIAAAMTGALESAELHVEPVRDSAHEH